jgi:hypothetical protein
MPDLSREAMMVLELSPVWRRRGQGMLTDETTVHSVVNKTAQPEILSQEIQRSETDKTILMAIEQRVAALMPAKPLDSRQLLQLIDEAGGLSRLMSQARVKRRLWQLIAQRED